MHTVFKAISIGFLVVSCTALPQMQYEGIEIAEIVQRIKCELAHAVPRPKGRYPSGDYQWFKYWTAKIDLSLDTNDQSALKPNVLLTEPIAGGTFTLGASGELSSQSQRIEKLSFTLSMQELYENRRSTYCQMPEQQGLLGNLGLQEWISSALAPVGYRQLTIGYHQPPVGKSGAGPIPGPSFRTEMPDQLLDQAKAAIKEAETSAEVAKDKAEKVLKYVTGTGVLPNQKVQSTYDQVTEVYSRVAIANTWVEAALELAWKASRGFREAEAALAKHFADTKTKIAQDTKLTDEQKAKAMAEVTAQEGRAAEAKKTRDSQLARIKTDATAAIEQINKARDTAKYAWELLPRDPPVDSITHTLKFVVTAGASITPNWTLARFRGPGVTNPLLGGSRIRTNQLDVVLGQPAEPGGKRLSEEQNRQLFNLQLDQLRARLVPIQIQ